MFKSDVTQSNKHLCAPLPVKCGQTKSEKCSKVEISHTSGNVKKQFLVLVIAFKPLLSMKTIVLSYQTTPKKIFHLSHALSMTCKFEKVENFQHFQICKCLTNVLSYDVFQQTNASCA